MKEYKNTPGESKDTLNEPAAVYETADANLGFLSDEEEDIPLDENGKPIGHTLEEFSAELDRKLSEHYGVDFDKVTRLIDAGKLNLEDVTDELLRRPEFHYESLR
jgi:hypothetical protein